MLQVHRLVKALEQALPAAQDDRRDRDRELLDVSGAQRLADHVRPRCPRPSSPPPRALGRPPRPGRSRTRECSTRYTEGRNTQDPVAGGRSLRGGERQASPRLGPELVCCQLAGTIRKVLGKPSTLTSGYREEGTMEESSAGAVLEHITQILEDSLTPSGMDQWLRARNRMLGGGRPLDLLDEGDAARVQEAARAFADGAYV